MDARAFVRDAVEYIAAAQALDDTIGTDRGFEILSPKVSYYLACHGIELGLKAVLVQAGWTEAQLRIGVGHSLVKAVAAVRQVGATLQLTSDEERLVGLLDQAYMRFRYPAAGQIEMPIWGPLTDVMIKVVKSALAAAPNSETAVRSEALERLTGFVSWHA